MNYDSPFVTAALQDGLKNFNQGVADSLQCTTPKPWKLELHNQREYMHLYITYDSPTRSQIIADLHCPISKAINASQEINKNIVQNAMLICKAVNSHDELCARLQSALTYIETYGGEVTANFAAGGWLESCKKVLEDSK